MTETSARWSKRVAAWQASGEDAEAFSRRAGYAASTLRWWASKLRREAAPVAEVRLARVVRRPPTTAEHGGGRIVIEAAMASARVVVEGGADRATLAMVLELLGVRVAEAGRP